MTALSSPAFAIRAAKSIAALLAALSLASPVMAVPTPDHIISPTKKIVLSPSTQARIKAVSHAMGRDLQTHVETETLAICSLAQPDDRGLCPAQLETLIGQDRAQRMISLARLKASPIWQSLTSEAKSRLNGFDYVLLTRATR